MAGNVTPEALEKATELITSALDPAAIVLFGSHATGRSGVRSDVDLAVLVAGEIPSWEQIGRLKLDLEEILGADVDVVILDFASPILAMQVLKEGRTLACRDAEALEAYTVRTLTDYADLKIIRAPIEKRLLALRTP